MLEGAGIVLQLPGDGAVIFGLVSSVDRIPQQQAGKHGGRGSAQDAFAIENQPAETGSGLLSARNIRGSGQLKGIWPNYLRGIAHIGPGDVAEPKEDDPG